MTPQELVDYWKKLQRVLLTIVMAVNTTQLCGIVTGLG